MEKSTGKIEKKIRVNVVFDLQEHFKKMNVFELDEIIILAKKEKNRRFSSIEKTLKINN